MKVGDLVVMPEHSRVRIGDQVGLIINSTIIRNRIGVLWSDGDGKVDYEPIQWLEVINESR